jgi:uncharacterized protein YcaQ
MKTSISAPLARRIALASQGFGGTRPVVPVGRRQIANVVRRLGLLQIDSVSAVVRAHYMPLFSRLGPYPMGLLDELAAPGRKRLLFEYWAHEASFLPMDSWPLLQWRMVRAAEHRGIYRGLADWARTNAGLIDDIMRKVTDEGPIAASDIEGMKGSGGWWGWSDAKHAFEWLFWAGRLTTASRRGFERLYDLPDRVIPAAIRERPVPDAADAHRELVLHAARALGIATAGDLRDYFRLSPEDFRHRIEELVEAGELIPVSVDGWNRPAWLHRDARLPRRIAARALLAPFDPLVWERARAERLFGFRYRIEIYVPAEKRQFGYYVLPFLLGDTIVARVDLRADRPRGILHVNAAYAEPGATADTAEELWEELELMRGWLGLDRLAVKPVGSLGPALAGIAASQPE